MLIRKIIGFGKNSHVITLPKEFLHNHNLVKGDFISMVWDQAGLMVTTSKEPTATSGKSIAISTEGKSVDRLRGEIYSAYVQNYSTITITSPTVYTSARAIIAIINSLSGLEILEQTATKIVAKDIMNIGEVSVKTLIRRMDIITRSMIDDTIKVFALEDQNKEREQKELAANIEQRDLEVNRLYFLAYRIVRKGLKDIASAKLLKMSPLELQNHYFIALRIERIADQAKGIAKDLLHISMKGKPKKSLQEMFKKIQEGFNETMKGFYNIDKDKAFAAESESDIKLKELDEDFEIYMQQILENKRKEKLSDLTYGCIIASRIVDGMKTMVRETRNVSRVVMGLYVPDEQEIQLVPPLQ